MASANNSATTGEKKIHTDPATFFRRCPNCGRRFEIRLVGTKKLESETLREERPLVQDYTMASPDEYLELEETVPTIVEIEQFQNAYRCKHCGYQWVEKKEKEVGVDEREAE